MICSDDFPGGRRQTHMSLINKTLNFADGEQDFFNTMRADL